MSWGEYFSGYELEDDYIEYRALNPVAVSPSAALGNNYVSSNSQMNVNLYWEDEVLDDHLGFLLSNGNVIGSLAYDFMNDRDGDDYFLGNYGDDIFMPGLGSDIVYGYDGIDQVKYNGVSRSAASLVKTSGGWKVAGMAIGDDTLIDVERIEFDDRRIALDLDGHAGQAAKLVGALLGPTAVHQPQYIGIVLDYLDEGWEYAALAGQAVNALGLDDPVDLVNTLWLNLFGTLPTAEQAQPFIDMLNSRTISAGALTVQAAESPYNLYNIDLVGLSQSGIEYV